MSSFTSATVIGGGTAPPGGGNTQFVPTSQSTQDTSLKNRTFYHRYEATGDTSGTRPLQQQPTAPPSSARDSHVVQNQQRHGHQIPTYSRGLGTSSFHPMQQDPSAFVSYIQSQQQAYKGSESAVVFDSMSGPAIYMHPHPNLRGGATINDRSVAPGQFVNSGLDVQQQNHQHYDMDPYGGARSSFENFRRFGGTSATGTSNLCEGTAVPSSAGIPSIVGTVSSSYLGGNNIASVDAMGTNIPHTSSSRHQLICVAEKVLQDYYTRLSQQPSSLASLYLDDAEIIYTGRELTTDAILITGKTEIEDFFSSETAAKFNGARVMVEALHPLVSPLSPYAVVLFVKGRVWFPRLSPHDGGEKSTSDKRSLKTDISHSQEDSYMEKAFKRNAAQQAGSSFVMSAFYHYLCMAPHPKCPSWGAPLQYFVANEHFHLSSLPLSPPVPDSDMKNTVSTSETGGLLGSRMTDIPRDSQGQQLQRRINEDFRMSVAASIQESGNTDPFPPIGETASVLMPSNCNTNGGNRLAMQQHNISSLRQNIEIEQQPGHHLHGPRMGHNVNNGLGFQENENHSSITRDNHNNNNVSLSKMLERQKGRVASAASTSQILEGGRCLGRHDSEDKSSSVKNAVLTNGRLSRAADPGSSSSSKGFNSSRYVRKNEQGGGPPPPSNTIRPGRRNQMHVTASSGSLVGGQSSFGVHQSEFSLHAAPSMPCDLPIGIEELKTIITEGISQVAGCENSICVDIYRPRNQDPSRPFFFIYVDSHQSMSALKAVGSITIQGNKRILLSPVKPPRSSYRQRFNNGGNISNSSFMRRTIQPSHQQTTNTTSVIEVTDREGSRQGTSNTIRSYIRSGDSVGKCDPAGNSSSEVVSDSKSTAQGVSGGPSSSSIFNNRSGNMKGPFQRNRWARNQGNGSGLNRNTYNSSQNMSRLGKGVSNDLLSETAKTGNSHRKDSPSGGLHESGLDCSVPTTVTASSTELCRLGSNNMKDAVEQVNTANVSSSDQGHNKNNDDQSKHAVGQANTNSPSL